jgi:hypothetical protein
MTKGRNKNVSGARGASYRTAALICGGAGNEEVI